MEEKDERQRKKGAGQQRRGSLTYVPVLVGAFRLLLSIRFLHFSFALISAIVKEI